MQFLGIASNPPWWGERKQSFGLSTVAEFRCKRCKTVGAVGLCYTPSTLEASIGF